MSTSTFVIPCKLSVVSLLSFPLSFVFLIFIRPHRRSTLFPYRRSSDLQAVDRATCRVTAVGPALEHARERGLRDRKSTRLNSSHRCISYAVFCLKKKRESHSHPLLQGYASTWKTCEAASNVSGSDQDLS